VSSSIARHGVHKGQTKLKIRVCAEFVSLEVDSFSTVQSWWAN